MGTISISSQGAVAILTLDRPEVRNAMDSAMVQEIADAFAQFDADDEVRAIVLAGSPPAFCSGIDTRQSFPGDLEALYRNGFAGRNAPARCRKPVIAAVSGAAFGAGCELALMADMIIADTTARFALPEITRDTLPGFGGTQRLCRLVGRIRAIEICMTGRSVMADEAERIGLVNRVVEPGRLIEEALSLATAVSSFSPVAAMMIKQSINSADETTLSSGGNIETLLSYISISIRENKK